jgi:hypothetical protein
LGLDFKANADHEVADAIESIITKEKTTLGK